MDTRLEHDIAYIKGAVSEYARHGTRCDALQTRLDRVQDEMRGIRSKLYDIDGFQTIVKGVLSGVGVMVVLALIVGIFKAAAVGPSNDTTQKTDASQQGETARPE